MMTPNTEEYETQKIYLTEIYLTELHSMKLMKTITNQQKPKVLLMVIKQNIKAKETKIKMYHVKNILI